MNRWLPLAGGMLLNVTLGSIYAWSVFVLPLEREFGWTRAQTSWVFTTVMLATTLSVVFAGALQDRRGPRLGALIGAFAIAAAYLLASLTRSLWFLYLTFGVIGGIGNGVGYSTAIPVASKWFPDRRGLAVGLMVGAYGAGSAVVGPVATHLLDQLGWRLTFRILGSAFFVTATAGAMMLRNPPADDRGDAATGVSFMRMPRVHIDVDVWQMLRTRTFYALWIAYCLGTTAGMMTISQLVPFARSSGLSPAAATFAITVGACGNVGGRVLAGWLSDVLGRLRTIRTMVLVSAAAMPTLFVLREHALLFYLLVALVYWCYGTQLSVFAATAADFFGTRNLGVNYGTLFTAVGLAGIIGPLLGAAAFDRFGDYRYAFFAASPLALVAFAALSEGQAPRVEPVGG
jgi:OFA family oxalate/formate antiporter-like MFS transporter